MIPFFPPDQLAILARAFLNATGARPNTVSIAAAGPGNNRVVGRLLKGHACNPKAIAALSRYFVEHWPTNLSWPSNIPNPRTSAFYLADSSVNDTECQSSLLIN